jgi:hypothetical protein
MKTAIAFITVMLTAARLPAQPPDVYTVSFLLGASSVKPNNTAAWSDLKIGSTVKLGDSLRIADESRLELTAPSKDVIKIGPGFRGEMNVALVASLVPAKRASGLSVLTQRDQANRVQSPTAVAAIRGKAAEEGTADPAADPEAEENMQASAKALLEEAMRLRDQVTVLLNANNEVAAATTLEMAEKLTQQALGLLEEK